MPKIESQTAFLNVILGDEKLRDAFAKSLGGLIDDDLRDIINSYGHNLFVSIVHAIRGEKVTPQARDFLMARLSPTEQNAIMAADLEALQAENIDAEKFNAKLAQLGGGLVDLLVSIGKLYLPQIAPFIPTPPPSGTKVDATDP